MSENQLTNPSREAEIAARIAKWAGLADDCTLPTVELGDMRYLLAHLQQARQERDALLATPAFDPLMVKVASTLGAKLDNARREGWQAGYSASEATYGLLRATATQAEAALQQAREALLKFGRHHDQCTHTFGMQDVPCTCGLDAALKAVR